MPRKPLKIKVVKGAIVPDKQTIVAALHSIFTELKSNPGAASLFAKNPDRFLANKGFSIDFRRELLSEAGFITGNKAGECFATGCFLTCICTGCCQTKNTIAIDIVTKFPASKKDINKNMLVKIRN